jgi:hypothetical protein
MVLGEAILVSIRAAPFDGSGTATEAIAVFRSHDSPEAKLCANVLRNGWRKRRFN